MKQLIAAVVCLALAGVASAYNIKHSYSGKNDSTEYYGACKSGEMLKVVQHSDGRFTYEGPAGNGTVSGGNGLDKAAAAACGE